MNQSMSDLNQGTLQRQYSTADNLKARIELHRRFSVNPQGWHRWLFEQIAFHDTDRILELGCGAGTLWSENVDRLPVVADLSISDFSEGMLQSAKAALNSVANRIHFEVINASSIPKNDHSLDTVIANHMLYHVPDLGQTVQEVRRILKEGGVFYAATNGLQHMHEIEELLEGGGAITNYQRDDLHQHFGLENGAENLSMSFGNVEMRLYDDALLVTESEPLIAYVLSTSACIAMEPSAKEAIVNQIQDVIAQHGAFRITKSSGLFIAK